MIFCLALKLIQQKLYLWKPVGASLQAESSAIEAFCLKEKQKQIFQTNQFSSQILATWQNKKKNN